MRLMPFATSSDNDLLLLVGSVMVSFVGHLCDEYVWMCVYIMSNGSLVKGYEVLEDALFCMF